MKKTTRKVPQSVKTQRKIDAAVDAELQKQSQTYMRVKQSDDVEIKLLRVELEQASKQPAQIAPDYVNGLLDETKHTGLVVPDWRGGWKWFSNLALAAIVAINTAPIPPEVLDGLPPDARQQVTIGLAVVGILGRFINQSRKKDDADV